LCLHGVNVVFTECCLSELPLSERHVRELPLYLHGSIVDTRQRGVHWVLFVGKLPLCLHGSIVDTRQRGVHWVLFVGKLPLCLHDPIVDTRQCGVR
jgi:hypothetical protein